MNSRQKGARGERELAQYGYRVTLVADTPDKEVEEEYFDAEALQEERPDIYSAYNRTRTVIKTGRSGYVRITAPKEGR